MPRSSSTTLTLYPPYETLHDQKNGKLSPELALALGTELVDNHNCPITFRVMYLAINYFRSGQRNFGSTFSAFSWIDNGHGHAVQTDIMHRFQKEMTNLRRRSPHPNEIQKILTCESLCLVLFPFATPEGNGPLVNGLAITETFASSSFIASSLFQQENRRRMITPQVRQLEHFEGVQPTGHYADQPAFWSEVASLLI